MASNFVARILGLKKKALQLEFQRNLVIMLCWVWLGFSVCIALVGLCLTLGVKTALAMRLRGDTARATELNWPKGCSSPVNTQEKRIKECFCHHACRHSQVLAVLRLLFPEAAGHLFRVENEFLYAVIELSSAWSMGLLPCLLFFTWSHGRG